MEGLFRGVHQADVLQRLTGRHASTGVDVIWERRRRIGTTDTWRDWAQVLIAENSQSTAVTTVYTSTPQTIADQKIFTTNPVIPGASAVILDATDTTHAATRAEVYATIQAMLQDYLGGQTG
jgi:hypothetical protein